MHREVFSKVIEHVASDEFAEALTQARDEYFSTTGKVFEDEPLYESRMTAFLEWYVLDRVLWDYGVPPIRLYGELFRDTLTEKERDVLGALEGSIHRIFIYVSKKGEHHVLKDVLDGSTYEITERRAHLGIQKGDLVDARLVRFGDSTHITGSMIVHPPEVLRFLSAEMQKAKEPKNLEKLLMDFMYMNLNRSRLGHVPAEQVYTWDFLRKEREGKEKRGKRATTNGH